jgi:hypothetical protein
MIKHNLTEENYFLDKEHLNCSTLKIYNECESKALAISKGQFTQDFSDSDAILIGKYVDAAIEGTLEEFIENNPKIYSRGKKENGLRKPFEEANEMINKIKNDKFANIMLSGDKQTIYVGEIAGVKVKCKIDNIDHEKGLFTDLKTARDIFETQYNADTKQRETFVQFRGYLIQLAFYREIIRQNTGKNYHAGIIAYDKTKNMAGLALIVQDYELDPYYDEVLRLLEKHKEALVKEKPHRCERCDYCNATRSHSLNFNSLADYLEFAGV